MNMNNWNPDLIKSLEFDNLLTHLKQCVDGYAEILIKLSREKIESVRLGDWSIQDILAHLAEWNQLTTENIKLLLAGDEITQWVDDSDIDAFNDKAVQFRRTLDLYTVALEFLQTSRSLVDLYLGLSDDQKDLRFREADSFTIRDSLRVDVDHFSEHYKQLVDALSQVPEDF